MPPKLVWTRTELLELTDRLPARTAWAMRSDRALSLVQMVPDSP